LNLFNKSVAKFVCMLKMVSLITWYKGDVHIAHMLFSTNTHINYPSNPISIRTFESYC
jgi:hypothetical protein